MSKNAQVEVQAKVSGRHTGKAAAIRKMKLKYPELSHHEIADRVGCSPQNVDQVLARFLGENTRDQVKTFCENKAEIYDAVQMRLLESVTKDDIQKSPVYPRVVAAGILEDKARTIRGQVTGIAGIHALIELVELIKANRG